MDYAQIAAKEKLTELQLRIRQLLDQVEQITKEQAYQRVSPMYVVCECFKILPSPIFKDTRGAVSPSQ